MKVFVMQVEISVCWLWMHIRNLWMSIQRLCTAVRSLQTEISTGCGDDSTMLWG